MLAHKVSHVALFGLASLDHHELHIIKIDRAPFRFQNHGVRAGGNQDGRESKSADHGTEGRKPLLILSIKRHIFRATCLTEVRKLCQGNFLFHFCSSILHLQLFFGYGILQKAAAELALSAPQSGLYNHRPVYTVAVCSISPAVDQSGPLWAALIYFLTETLVCATTLDRNFCITMLPHGKCCVNWKSLGNGKY